MKSISDHPFVRRLFHDETSKIHFLRREGKKVIEESGTVTRIKQTEKEFPNEDAAKLQVKKKELDLLKKGFVYRNSSAKPGEASLHYFLTRFYTGALSFQNTEQGIYLSAVGHDPDPRTDFLDLIDQEGHLVKRVDLPRNLPWEMAYSKENGLLILLLDKCVYAYVLSTGEIQPLMDTNPREFSPKSFSTNAGALVFNSKETICFFRNATAALGGKFDFEWTRNQDQVALALSSDAKLLAMLNKNETVELIETETGKTLAELSIGTNAIDQMRFMQHNQLLVFKDNQGYWKVRFFDLNSGKEILLDWIEQPAYDYAFYFAINDNETRLAIAYGYYVVVYDLVAKKRLFDFQFEHSAKKAEIKFVGDLLGARTDTGCFSLYKV